jgi:hypothetical protein
MSERGAASGGWGRRLVLAVLLATGGSLLATFGFFFFRDNFSTHYPMKVVSAAAWRAGAIPWWNTTDGGGQPLAGNPNSLTFYPDNVLYLFLPPHVAFNLHFLLHLLLGWIAMRTLIRECGAPASSRLARRHPAAGNQGQQDAAPPAAWKAALLQPATFGAWLWVLSGAAVSALAFYNLVTAIALIPFALWAARSRSPLVYGGAFGLLILGTEPVTVVATALVVAVVAPRNLDRPGAPGAQPATLGTSRPVDYVFDLDLVKRTAIAVVVAALIALPQIIAYSEIAGEVERSHGYSAQTALNASLDPRRLLELLIGPFLHIDAPHLFPSLLIGLIAIPALARRSRWTAAAAMSLFFALGRFNPLVRIAVEAMQSLRFARYPEKFALPLCAALVVLAAMFFEQTKAKGVWLGVTFIPLLAWACVTIPIDWWSPYELDPQAPQRIYMAPSPLGQLMSRAEYRALAQGRAPLFGATAGLRYVLNRSGDGMHSTLSRIVAERYAATHEGRYLTIAAELPMAMFVPRALGVASINDAVLALERSPLDVRQTAVAPASLNGFVSDPRARVTSYRELPEAIEIEVDTPGDALLLVNQSYFTAWDTGGSLRTVPLDIDRLGVIVRGGTKRVTLRFGHRRTAVLAAWVISSALLLAALLALSIEKGDRGAREVERAADEDRAG